MRKKTQTESSDGFLSRWSTKKSHTENPLARRQDLSDQDELIDDKDLAAEDTENQLAEDTADKQPVLTDEDMPDVETLDEKSDFSGFLSPGVSDELRKLALRKLFRSKVFNVRDGLDDYDDDFRSFAALGDIITSDMKHQMELEEERQKETDRENQQQQSLSEDEQLAMEEGVADNQAREDQQIQDQHSHAENSENQDSKQKNETGEMASEETQDPQT